LFQTVLLDEFIAVGLFMLTSIVGA